MKNAQEMYTKAIYNAVVSRNLDEAKEILYSDFTRQAIIDQPINELITEMTELETQVGQLYQMFDEHANDMSIEDMQYMQECIAELTTWINWVAEVKHTSMVA